MIRRACRRCSTTTSPCGGSANTDLMGAVGGLAMHEGRGAQGVLERLPQQRVAPVTYTAENMGPD